MDSTLKTKLINLAKKHISPKDVSHDFNHALRVLQNAEKIAQTEGADLDILIPSALFHDLIVHPKNHPSRAKSQEDSAKRAQELLRTLPEFPQEKVKAVTTCIRECSFTKAPKPSSKESAILQDADMLEATGAIAIMRTFASTGLMGKPLYNAKDPFCKKRKPHGLEYALDLFWERLLKVQERMNTKTGREMAKKRTQFLEAFLKELEEEFGVE